jgi:hypothetical protein
MSKKISFKGQLPMGEQDRIRLKTMQGKVGYKITKFQLMPATPGAQSNECIGQIFSTDQTGSITTAVDFTNSDLLAVHFIKYSDATTSALDSVIIFDNAKINQDIFINVTDARGETNRMNYYVELETMALSDLEATQLTLQSIRSITS